VNRRVLLGLLLACLACAPDEPLPGPDVVARIGGRDVRHADFEAHLRRNLGGEGEALSSEALSAMLDQFLEERLLLRAAVDRGLVGPDASVERAVAALLAALPSVEPPAEEIQAWYDAHRAELARPEKVELEILLLPDRERAEEARRRLLDGVDPEQIVAGEEDETGTGGLQRGVFARDDLPPAFASIVFDLPEGRTSDVVEADYGFHVFRLLRRIPAEEPSLERVRDEIVRRLRSARTDAGLERLVADAGSRYAVQVFDRNLPFAYRGTYPVSRPYENR